MCPGENLGIICIDTGTPSGKVTSFRRQIRNSCNLIRSLPSAPPWLAPDCLPFRYRDAATPQIAGVAVRHLPSCDLPPHPSESLNYLPLFFDPGFQVLSSILRKICEHDVANTGILVACGFLWLWIFYYFAAGYSELSGTQYPEFVYK